MVGNKLPEFYDTLLFFTALMLLMISFLFCYFSTLTFGSVWSLVFRVWIFDILVQERSQDFAKGGA